MPTCPKIPLSHDELMRLDEHAEMIKQTLEAALLRHAPADWKAYYRYCLAYLNDPSKPHGPLADMSERTYIHFTLKRGA